MKIGHTITFLIVFLLLITSILPPFRFRLVQASSSTSFKVAATADDGYVAGMGSPSYPPSATQAYTSGTNDLLGQTYYWDDEDSRYEYDLYRLFYEFETSTIPSAATITSANLTIYVYADYSTTDFSIQARKWTGSLPITTADWAQYDTTNYGTLSTSGISVDAWNTITLSNVSLIQKAASTMICFISSRDGTEPSGSEYITIDNYGTGTNDWLYAPRLNIAYTLNTNGTQNLYFHSYNVTTNTKNMRRMTDYNDNVTAASSYTFSGVGDLNLTYSTSVYIQHANGTTETLGTNIAQMHMLNTDDWASKIYYPHLASWTIPQTPLLSNASLWLNVTAKAGNNSWTPIMQFTSDWLQTSLISTANLTFTYWITRNESGSDISTSLYYGSDTYPSGIYDITLSYADATTIYSAGQYCDGWEKGDGTDLSTGDIYTLTDDMNWTDTYYSSMIRFPNIQKTATQIASATAIYLNLYAYHIVAYSADMTIYGEKTIESKDFHYVPTVMNRTRTGNFTTWYEITIPTPTWKQVNITGVVREIVALSGWTTGKAITLLLIANLNNSQNGFLARSWDNAAYQPYLSFSDTSPPTLANLYCVGDPTYGNYTPSSRQYNTWFMANISMTDFSPDQAWLEWDDGTPANQTLTYEAGTSTKRYSHNFTDLLSDQPYSFKIFGNDTSGYQALLVNFSKANPFGGNETAYFYANCTKDDGANSYKIWYIAPFNYTNIRTKCGDGGQLVDGTVTDTKYMSEQRGDIQLEAGYCTNFVFLYFNTNRTFTPFNLDSVYIHFWWNTASEEATIGFKHFDFWQDNSFDFDESYDTNASMAKANQTFTGFQYDYYYLEAKLWNLTSDYLVSPSNIDGLSFGLCVGFPSILGNSRYGTYIVTNLPSNATLAGLDTDSDEVTDFDELFVYYSDPFMPNADQYKTLTWAHSSVFDLSAMANQTFTLILDWALNHGFITEANGLLGGVAYAVVLAWTHVSSWIMDAFKGAYVPVAYAVVLAWTHASSWTLNAFLSTYIPVAYSITLSWIQTNSWVLDLTVVFAPIGDAFFAVTSWLLAPSWTIARTSERVAGDVKIHLEENASIGFQHELGTALFTVDNGVLNGSGVTLGMSERTGTLNFLNLEECDLTLHSESIVVFTVNGVTYGNQTSQTLTADEVYSISWEFFGGGSPAFWLPIKFILGMVGLVAMPVGLIMIVTLAKHQDYNGILNAFIITMLGLSLFIVWLW